MAEVKQSRAESEPSYSKKKKKPPSFSSNGGVSSSSSSFKHIYDDVLGASSPSMAQSSNCLMEDDYAEVFGCSKSSNGVWSISYSSIPILELPKDKGVGGKLGEERVDYGGVFGGVFDSDSHSHSFGLPDGQELFDQLKKKHKTSSPHTLPRSQGQTSETTSPEISGQSYDGQAPTNGFCHVEPGNNGIVNMNRGPREAAHVRAYSLHEVSATQKTLLSQTPVVNGDMVGTNSKLEKKQGKHARHTSLDLGANKHNSNSNAFLRKESGMRGLYSVDTSHGTSQSSNTATNELCQSVDNTKHSEYKVNELNINNTSETTHAADVHPIQESNHSLPELLPIQKTLSSTTSVLGNKSQSGIDVNLATELSKHSRNTSLDLDANRQSGKFNPVFQKACGSSESTSIHDSHETCQASFTAGPSKVLKDDAEIAIGCDEVKKKGRRSRMTSLDLGDYKHSCERDDGLKRKPRLGGSYSFDASHDSFAAHIKVQPSKIYPSSSLPQFFPVESHYKVSENSSCKSSQKNLYRGAGGSPPSLAEELDVNSAAAVSAAALQRAIEEAEMRIRLAKAFLEREGQGSKNLRFKDTLKVKVSKENGVTNEINNFKQTEMHKCSSPIDSEMQPCSPLERKSVVEDGQGPQEDQTMFDTNGEPTEGKNAEVSNLITGDNKHEGGEWEAAKHFNQLISGVKNRLLASFMSWQTDSEAEKKEDLKDNVKPQHLPEEFEHDLRDHDAFKKSRTEKNHSTATSAGKAMNGENRMQFASEALEPEEDTAGNKVDLIPDTAGPSSANFQFFAFRNQILCDPSDPVEEKKRPQESRESEIVNGQEQLKNEVSNEHIPCLGDEASWQEPDDKCEIDDTKKQDNMYVVSDIDSNDEENGKTFEEPCSLDEHNEMELSHEGDEQDIINWKGDNSFINGDNVEMVEEHYSMAGHYKKKPTHEEGGLDDTSRKSHISSISEEKFEIVEELHSLAGHDVKGLTHKNDGQDDMCKKSHLDSRNDLNNEIVKELSIQAERERNNFVYEEDNCRSLDEEFKEKSTDNSHHCENTAETTDTNSECEVLKEATNQHENVEIIEEFDLVGETWKKFEATEGVFGGQENERDQTETNYIEGVSGQTYRSEEIRTIHSETDHIEKTAEKVILQATCIVSAEEECKQNENVFLTKGEACSFVESSSTVEAAVYSDEEIERKMDIAYTSSEPEMDRESSVSAQKASESIGEWPPVSAQKESEMIGKEPALSSVSSENNMEFDRYGIKESLTTTIGTLPDEILVPHDSEPDMSSGQKDVDINAVGSVSLDNLENQTDLLQESGEFDTTSDQDVERSGVETGHRRRRWFDSSGRIGTAEQPSILEGNRMDLEIDQEVLDESELAGSVEIHADKLDCSDAKVTTTTDADNSSNQNGSSTNVETTPTRRKWFAKRGEEGLPEPLNLFEGIKVNLEVPLQSVKKSVMHNISGNSLDDLNTNSGESLNAMKSDVVLNGEKGKQSGEAAPRRRRWFESGETVGSGQQVRFNDDVGLTIEIDQASKAKGGTEKHGQLDSMSILLEKDDVHNKVEPVKEHNSNLDDLNRKEKEREKEKLAVERAIREARERAFAEARERARRGAAEKTNVEARQRVSAGVQEKLGKVSSEATNSSDKASTEAKLQAERAAVERATAEARERALQRALSEKASHRSREQAGRHSSEKNSSLEPKYQSSRCSDSSSSDNVDGADVESAQRRKARLERQKRTMERATHALEEKNKRDLLAQKEQAAKNMLADSLDVEVKRWSTGKEGNLRALLSTLQYILGPESGWQPVSLTDLVAATAVRKSYKKATLCVHPDKLQQRGATIQQKYICEKVFDLLKEARSKFNPDEC